MKRALLTCLITFLCLNASAQQQKEYIKTYFSNGKIKSEGWSIGETKTGYWIFYSPNGKILSKGHYKNNIREKYWYFYNQNGSLINEGHFSKNKKTGWWIFYNKGKLSHKSQYEGDELNGFSIWFKNDNPKKVEKYAHNKKINEWTDAKKFKEDNNIPDYLWQ